MYVPIYWDSIPVASVSVTHKGMGGIAVLLYPGPKNGECMDIVKKGHSYRLCIYKAGNILAKPA
jgi:hypothetical protein